MVKGLFDRYLNSTRAIYTAIASIFLGCIVYYFFFPGKVPPDPIASQPVETSPVEHTASEKVKPAPTSKQRQPVLESTKPIPADNRAAEIESKIAKAKNEQFLESVAKLTSKSETVSSELASLNGKIGELDTNEVGRRIAKNPTLVRDFVAFKDLTSKLADQVSAVCGEIKIFDLEVHGAVELRPELVISDSLKSSSQKLGDSLGELAKTIDKKRLGLDAIVRSAGDSQPSELTLAEAIKRIDEDDERLVLDAEKAKRQKEKQAKLAEVEKAKHDNELAAIDAEKVQIKNEQLVIEAKKKADAAEVERKRKLTLLEAEFERALPEIKHYLGPLFKSSAKQPQGTGTKEEKESGPVSYSALMACGVGNPDIRKACGSLLLFFSYTKAGGRGIGPYEALYNGAVLTDEQLDRVRPAYNLLDKYGLLMVEKGMLAK